MDPRRKEVIRRLLVFFGLSFGIAWGIAALLILERPLLESIVGPIGNFTHHWLYFVAVYAPSLSAVICSLVFGGWEGLKALGRRFTRPFNPIWLAVAVLLWPTTLALYELATSVIGRGGSVDLHAIFVGMPLTAFTTTMLLVDPGGLGEETGWRGFALPHLFELFRPFTAGAILGAIWGLWHLPAFFIGDTVQSHFAFGWFLLDATAFGLVMTWLFVRSNGNVIVAGIIPHLVANLTNDARVFQIKDSIAPETILMWLLVAVLWGVFGRDLWRKRASAGEHASAAASNRPLAFGV